MLVKFFWVAVSQLLLLPLGCHRSNFYFRAVSQLLLPTSWWTILSVATILSQHVHIWWRQYYRSNYVLYRSMQSFGVDNLIPIGLLLIGLLVLGLLILLLIVLGLLILLLIVLGLLLLRLLLLLLLLGLRFSIVLLNCIH